MSQFFASRLSALAPYTPGEQPQGMESLIKLNTNELPYPPPQSVCDAAAAQAASANLYNDPEAKELREALALSLGTKADNVFVGNGSDEVLALCFQGFCEKGVAYADLTYGFYPVYAQLYGCDAKVVPVEEDFSIDVVEYFGFPGTIFIANPNAPTSIALPAAEIERLVKQNPQSLVVVDEAYVKFGGETCMPLTERYDNILVVGTFSKAWAMAGARLGYAVGCRDLIDDLNRLKYSLNPYNVNSMTQKMGISALKEQAYYAECVGKVCATRELFLTKLREIGFVAPASATNFVFCRHPKYSGEELFWALRNQGIVVRWFSRQKIKEYLRITIGTAEQMDRVLEALRGLTGN